MKPAILVIAGFDPCSGAGISADILTCQGAGAYGMGAVSALTRQTHDQFLGVQWLPWKDIRAQLAPLIEEYPIAAVKIGLLENTHTLLELIGFIHKNLPQVPVVWDPVLKSSLGFPLHQIKNDSGIWGRLTQNWVVTPNREEAIALFPDLASAPHLDRLKNFPNAFLIKSWESEGTGFTDVLISAQGLSRYSHPFLKEGETHGSGCFLSTSLAVRLALGDTLPDAAARAIDRTQHFLKSGEGNRGDHQAVFAFQEVGPL